jgi:D-glycero-alpha-D-manno-heptose-7-phosphate kinase
MKKKLANRVTNEAIDESYRVAKEAGALGGKVTGAGGGGFLLLYCSPECQPDVASRLKERGLQQVRFQFDFLGAHILMNSTESARHPGVNEPGLWVLERARRAGRRRAA